MIAPLILSTYLIFGTPGHLNMLEYDKISHMGCSYVLADFAEKKAHFEPWQSLVLVIGAGVAHELIVQSIEPSIHYDIQDIYSGIIGWSVLRFVNDFPVEYDGEKFTVTLKL